MLELEKKKFLSHVYILGFFTVVSKLFGLIRDRLLASHFGQSATLDAYFVAFRIPDFIYNLIVLGTVSAAFVPVFLNYIAKKRTREAYEIANSVMNVTTLIMGALAALAFVFARPLTHIIAPGFIDRDTVDLTITLMRWMLVSPILFGIAAVLSGILNAYRRFVVYSLSSALYNVGIIVGILFLVPHFGPQALAWGVILGAVVNLVVQIPSVMAVGYHWEPRFDLKSPGFLKVMRLMFPRMIGFAALQISLFVTTAIATTLQTGSTAVYNFALNLQYFPVTIFGISIATAVFPLLALTASKQDVVGFRENFSLSFRKIIFFVVPVSILMLLFRAQIVRILYGTGNFDWQATILTLETLGYFTISLFAQSLIPLLTRAFYSIQNTKIPVVVGTISMVLNIVLAVLFGPFMGVPGLALAFSLANVFNAAVLLVVLRMQVGDLDDNHITVSTTKTILASLGMGIAAYGMLRVAASFLNTHTYAGLISQAVIAGLVGLAVFLALQYLLKSEELAMYAVFLKRKAKGKS